MKQLTPRWVALVTITAITLYVTWLIVQPFIGVILWALVLTVIASPIRGVISRYNRSPTVTALLTLVVVLFVVVIPIAFIAQAVVSRADEAVAAFQRGVELLSDRESPHMQWLAQYVDVEYYFSAENARAQAKKVGGFLAAYSADIVGWTFVILVQFLLVLFTTFYMLRDGGRLLIAARDLLPLKAHQADAIFDSIRTIISASLRGTILIAVIQGFLGGLAFWVLGIPAAVLWGVVMFLMSIIPVVGSSVVWVPAAVYLAASGNWGKALLLTVWGAGVISMVDNILRPILVGSKTRMHELTVFFSVLGGLKVFGPVGIVVGPIVIALAVGLMKIFQDSGQDGDELPPSERPLPHPQPQPIAPAALPAEGPGPVREAGPTDNVSRAGHAS